jgi:hypothetical protein
MKLINGTTMCGADGPVDIRHGEPARAIRLVSRHGDSCRVPMVTWYWGVELVTVVWSRSCRRGSAILRVPPEQPLLVLDAGAERAIRAGDLSVGMLLAMFDGSGAEIEGLRDDRVQASLANVLFDSPGVAVVDGGPMIPA